MLLPSLRRRDNLRFRLGCAVVLARTVCRIFGDFDFREPLHARGVDLGDAVLEHNALDLFRDLTILDFPFKGDELPLLKLLGEAGEIAPGVDAMPLSAVFVIALFVLPALAGRQAEN